MMEDLSKKQPNFPKNRVIILIGFEPPLSSLAYMHHDMGADDILVGVALPPHDCKRIHDMAMLQELSREIRQHLPDVSEEGPDVKQALSKLIGFIDKLDLNLLLPSRGIALIDDHDPHSMVIPTRELIPLNCPEMISDETIRKKNLPHFPDPSITKYWGSNNPKYLKRVEKCRRQKTIGRTKRRRN